MTDPMSQANHSATDLERPRQHQYLESSASSVSPHSFYSYAVDLLQAQPKIAAALDADNSAYFATILLQATLVSGAYQLLHTHEYIVGIGLRWFAVTDEVSASRTLPLDFKRSVWSRELYAFPVVAVQLSLSYFQV